MKTIKNLINSFDSILESSKTLFKSNIETVLNHKTILFNNRWLDMDLIKHIDKVEGKVLDFVWDESIHPFVNVQDKEKHVYHIPVKDVIRILDED